MQDAPEMRITYTKDPARKQRLLALIEKLSRKPGQSTAAGAQLEEGQTAEAEQESQDGR